MSTAVLPRLAPILVLVACSYRPSIPAGAVKCQGLGDCPVGERCVAIESAQPLSVCCPALGCGPGIVPLELADAAAPADAPAPRSDAPTPAPDGPSPSPDAPALPPDLAGPPAPDTAPAPPDLIPDGPPACPGNLAGPALVQAGGYCIDATEVTNAQYKLFLAAGPDPTGGLAQQCARNQGLIPNTFRNPWSELRVQYRPVVNVDWCDAQAFCKWAGKSLCTRERWIGACGGPMKTAYSYGDAYQPMACNTAVSNAENSGDPLGLLWDAGSRATCWGGYPSIRDMSGNVAEWTATCVKPTAGSLPHEEECWSMGGSIEDYQPSEYTCSYGYVDQSSRLDQHYFRGFRCCWP